jgi:hypothetical protein
MGNKMNSWKAVTIALSMFATSASSWAGFFNGNKLHGWLLEKENPNGSAFEFGLFSGYVAGVVDVGDGILFCTGPGVTAGQYNAVVAKYIKNNPEKWNKSADSLVVEALKEAFPCKK